jgi:hypothetical protein
MFMPTSLGPRRAAPPAPTRLAHLPFTTRQATQVLRGLTFLQQEGDRQRGRHNKSHEQAQECAPEQRSTAQPVAPAAFRNFAAELAGSETRSAYQPPYGPVTTTELHQPP